ncbi:acyltransferase [Neorhizobium sp. P12A]|uniref:acyltransferase family protein n=1 Tax=Neorhizobium sp. P12A TaxID=2268027 RepID=UPI00165EAAC5|nr:acyltransferase [Neorhizobium sp. P12A]
MYIAIYVLLASLLTYTEYVSLFSFFENDIEAICGLFFLNMLVCFGLEKATKIVSVKKSVKMINKKVIAQNSRAKFYGIDVVRGFATCMVALAHVAYRTGEPQLGGHKAFWGTLDGLFICVDFFFVLSGFLIAWVHFKDFGNPARVPNYFKRRFSRIFPVYWIVLTLFIIGQFIQPSTAHPHEFTPKLILTSYFLLPNSGPTLMEVAWTLYYEIVGYLAFALLLCFGRIGGAILAAWAAWIIIANIIAQPTEFPANFYLNAFHLEFLMGIGGAVLLRKGSIPFPRVMATVGTIVFVSMIYFRVDALTDSSNLAMRLIVGTSASMVILGLIQAERTGKLSIPPSLQTFGAASYSIYLTHTIIQAPTIKFGWRFFSHFPSEIWMFMVAGISIAVGYIFHRLVELPATELVKNLVMREPAVAAE